MLNHLIKHEWKETWKIPLLSCVLTIFMTLICTVCFTRMEPPATEEALNFGAFFLVMGFSVFSSCISIVTTIYFGVRFYKNLYSDEGYLMHTLPVTPRQLTISKTLISAFWFFILQVLVVWAVSIVMSLGMPVMVKSDEVINLRWWADNSSYIFGMSIPAFGIFYLVTSIISSFSSTLIMYASISLGQLFSKHKVMASILCYLGYNMLVQTVTSIAMTPALTKMIISGVNATTTNPLGVPDFFGPFIRDVMIGSATGSLLIGAASYILTEYIMKKQLNLD